MGKNTNFARRRAIRRTLLRLYKIDTRGPPPAYEETDGRRPFVTRCMICGCVTKTADCCVEELTRQLATLFVIYHNRSKIKQE